MGPGPGLLPRSIIMLMLSHEVLTKAWSGLACFVLDNVMRISDCIHCDSLRIYMQVGELCDV